MPISGNPPDFSFILVKYNVKKLFTPEKAEAQVAVAVIGVIDLPKPVPEFACTAVEAAAPDNTETPRIGARRVVL